MIIRASEILKRRQVATLQSASREYPCHPRNPWFRYFFAIRVHSWNLSAVADSWLQGIEDFPELRPAISEEGSERLFPSTEQ